MPSTFFGIGETVGHLRDGKRVSRRGWNGKGMYLYFVKGVGTRLPFVMMVTPKGDHVPWLCSQTDLLESDYFIAS